MNKTGRNRLIKRKLARASAALVKTHRLLIDARNTTQVNDPQFRMDIQALINRTYQTNTRLLKAVRRRYGLSAEKLRTYSK